MTFVVVTGTSSPAHALREPRSETIDGRMKTLHYHPDEVYKFTGYYYFQTIIDLDPKENISTISVGIPTGWNIQPAGNRIFIKPIANRPEDAVTNMTVITDKRMYFFELHAATASDVTDQSIPFIIRFIYPEESVGTGIMQFSTSPEPKFGKDANLNYNYTITGPEYFAPTQIFDDGTHTYFKFRKDAPMPAFFEVNNMGYESLVNYVIQGELVVVEKLGSRFTLRFGDESVCVFNEIRPMAVIADPDED